MNVYIHVDMMYGTNEHTQMCVCACFFIYPNTHLDVHSCKYTYICKPSNTHQKRHFSTKNKAIASTWRNHNSGFFRGRLGGILGDIFYFIICVCVMIHLCDMTHWYMHHDSFLRLDVCLYTCVCVHVYTLACINWDVNRHVTVYIYTHNNYFGGWSCRNRKTLASQNEIKITR